MPHSAAKERSVLERFLGAFAPMKPGEGLVSLLMFSNIFLILTSYYVLKTVREGLMLGGGGFLGFSGAEIKSYSNPVMALLLMALVLPAYNALANKVSRLRLVNLSIAFVIVSLIGFCVVGATGTPIAIPFFVWLGIVNMFLISQFWSYANDVHSAEQGKRLFAFVALGGSAGAILGPLVAAQGKAHTYGLMLVAAGLLGICALLYNLVDRLLDRDGTPGTQEREPMSKSGGFSLVFRSRYLLLIAVMLLLSNIVNTTGEFVLANAAETFAAEQHPDSAFSHMVDESERRTAVVEARTTTVNEFYGRFYFWVNLASVLIQAFVVSRLFRFAGVRAALFVLPVIAFGAYAAIALVGGLALLRFAKTAENATDYSLQNTVRQALFLPTSRSVKYKAKAAMDTFFVRIGDTLSALLVYAGVQHLSFSARDFAFTNILLVALWILVVIGISRYHKQMSATRGAP